MRALRPEEEWASHLMSRALGVPVAQHDDGSTNGMHDLDVLYPDRPTAAVEVTSATDGDSVVLWNLMNGDGRWTEPGLAGGWMVSVEPSARAKRLRSELPQLLGDLERAELSEIRPNQRAGSEFDARARGLGIVTAHQGGTDFPGSIYVTIELPIERTGGFVADTADALASWLGDFLRETAQGDVAAKLARSPAVERHAFIFLPTFTTAPFEAMAPLIGDGVALPAVDPDLPDAITDVWAVSAWSTGVGMRWSSGVGWRYFDKG